MVNETKVSFFILFYCWYDLEIHSSTTTKTSPMDDVRKTHSKSRDPSGPYQSANVTIRYLINQNLIDPPLIRFDEFT